MIVSQLALSPGTPACAACFSTSLSCSISSIGANNSPGCLVILSSLTSAFAQACRHGERRERALRARLSEHRPNRRHLGRTRHFFSMFQKATLEATSTPSMFLRKALGCRYCPRTTCVGYSEARSLTASAMDFCLAGSVSLAKASRRRSNSLSHGQPNVAFSQLALRKLVATGSSTSTPPQEVR